MSDPDIALVSPVPNEVTLDEPYTYTVASPNMKVYSFPWSDEPRLTEPEVVGEAHFQDILDITKEYVDDSHVGHRKWLFGTSRTDDNVAGWFLAVQVKLT